MVWIVGNIVSCQPWNNVIIFYLSCNWLQRNSIYNILTGVSPSECADNDGHNTDAIDALTLTVPVIIKYADATPEERNRKVSIDDISHPYQQPYLHILSMLMCIMCRTFFVIGKGNNICNKKNSRARSICWGFLWHACISFTRHWFKNCCWTVQSEFERKRLARRNDIRVSK